MYKVISLSRPESDLPKDVQEVESREDADEIAQHMKSCGSYVVVERDGFWLYSLDGRA